MDSDLIVTTDETDSPDVKTIDTTIPVVALVEPKIPPLVGD